MNGSTTDEPCCSSSKQGQVEDKGDQRALIEKANPANANNHDAVSDSDYSETFSNLPESKIELRSLLKKKDASTKSPRKKVVSFSSECSSRKISSARDCFTYMQTGSNLVKVKSGSRRYERYFSLDADCVCLRWSPSMKRTDKAKLPIDAIKEIRIGRNTENLRNTEAGFEDLPEDCAFSIIWGDEYQYLDLIANTPDEANIWITGLVALTSGSLFEAPTNTSTFRDIMLERFYETNIGDDDTRVLDEDNFVDLLLRLNPSLSRNEILTKRKEMESLYRLDGTLKPAMMKKEFCDVYRAVSTRPEIYHVLFRYANKDYLTAADLQIFLQTEQTTDSHSLEACTALIDKYEPFPLAVAQSRMTVDGFTNFLTSPDCYLFDYPVHGIVCQDMTQPFANYFISSSYNTYLAGNQQRSASTTDAYVYALRLGCKYIEMDVWESTDPLIDEPVIFNGLSIGAKLPVTLALQAIKQYAFHKSSYPLIIQLRNRLDVADQKKLAKLFRVILADSLYVDANAATNDEQSLPSPEQFKGKILIKGKKLIGDESEGEVSDEEEGYDGTRTSRAIEKTRRGSSKRRVLCKELSDLICPFLQSFTINDFSTVMQRQKRYQVGSLNETVALRLTNHYSYNFVNYTRNFLTRVYPNSVRTDKSNLNPQEFWNYGCQLAALNVQTPGLMMHLATGKFLANGQSGYVLKPLIMRDNQACFSPKDVLHTTGLQTLYIKVISAQQLKRPLRSTAKGDSLDPYVVVDVFGVPCDCAAEKTKTVKNDNFNPVFDENFTFEITLPELALIRFLVLDDEFISDDFIGQYTVPFECMRTGFRHLNLLDLYGQPIENSTLFVYVRISNKFGGIKPLKRGASLLLRRKTEKIHTGIKQVGVKRLDDIFKPSLSALIECLQLRNNLENDLVQWQESCGLGPGATMRQGLRLMQSRISAANSAHPGDQTVQLLVDVDDGFPVMELEGPAPEIIRKSCQSFDQVFAQCKRIIQRSDALVCKIEEHSKRIAELYNEFCSQQNVPNITGQQASRVSENFAWNLRIVKSQAEIMEKTTEQCQEYVKQMINTACLLNILKNQCKQPCSHRTQQTNSV